MHRLPPPSYFANHPTFIQKARDYYVHALQDMDESPLDEIVTDESRKSVYRLVTSPVRAPSSFIVSPAVLIQITEGSHCLTVLLKAGELEETITIDPCGCLFHEHFRSLQENIDKLNFWSWSKISGEIFIAYCDFPNHYTIEVVHQDQYHWSSRTAPKEEDFRTVCRLFLDLTSYVGSIPEGQVIRHKEYLSPTYYQVPKVQTAQEIEQEIEAELQALKSNLID